MGWQIKKSFAYPERLEPVPNGPGVQRIVGHATRNANARDGNTWWEDCGTIGEALKLTWAGCIVRPSTTVPEEIEAANEHLRDLLLNPVRCA